MLPLLAHSKTHSIVFSGLVTSITPEDASNAPSSKIQIGDDVSGSYTVDTATADEVVSEPFVGRYHSDHFQVNINGNVYESENNTVEVTNDAKLDPNSQIIDAIEVVSPLRNVSGPDLFGLPIAQAGFVLVDTTAVVFPNDALPTSFSIGDFDATSPSQIFSGAGGRIIAQSPATGELAEVRFSITSIEATFIADADQDGGYYLTANLWAKAVLRVPGNPVPLNYKEVGVDTTPNGARVVSGMFYARPDKFTHGSPSNAEAFIKVYIHPGGWGNIAFNHVNVDDIEVFSANNYNGTADQSGNATLDNRLVEHSYSNVRFN